MSKRSPGFVLPPQAPPPQYPGYPNQPPAHPNQHYSHNQQMYPGNQPFPAPIQQQPGRFDQQTVQWSNSNFSTYLTNATSFHVKQKVELLEALIGWETGNKYTVLDQGGHKIFYAGEESDMCSRQLCNARRPFTLTIKDKAGQNVMIMTRKLDCSCCCGLICPDSLQVSTPNGQLLGTVDEESSILYPTFKIRDAAGNTVLRVQGPLCPLSCGGSVVFRVMNMAGVTVGTISKEWSGIIREFLTDADNFSISFPYDLDQSVKAVLLGALFLIDYEYFESGATDDRQGGRRLFA